ncbi:hypothetical protein H6776_02540 [Candidatus Nomurabacteria bacterium]|nr:hypothetical protein [Candidatus Nomurabacteria bacterium]
MKQPDQNSFNNQSFREDLRSEIPENVRNILDYYASQKKKEEGLQDNNIEARENLYPELAYDPYKNPLDLFYEIMSSGVDDASTDILYALKDMPENFSQLSSQELEEKLQTARGIQERKLNEAYTILETRIVSGNPQEQYNAFHDLLSMEFGKFEKLLENPNLTGLKDFFENLDTTQGAYYYQRYFETYQHEGKLKYKEKVALSNGGELQSWSSYPSTIKIYTNPQEKRKQYELRERYDELTHNAHDKSHSSPALEKIIRAQWNLKSKIKDTPITSQRLGLVTEVDQQDIKDYVEILLSRIGNDIESDFNFKLNELPLDLGIQFINFIKHATKEKVDRTQVLSQQHGKYFIHTFLSLAHGGPEMGEKILELGEQLPPETAQKIFNKYAELVDRVNEVLEFTKNGFKQELQTQPEMINDIQQTLYKRGVALLDNFYQDIQSSQDIESLATEIEQQLDRINADTVTTLAVFKHALREGHQLPLEDIKGATFESHHPSDFTPEQIAEMRDIYETNWEHYSDKAFVQHILKYFDTAFDTSNTLQNTLYTFEKDNHIQAFIRFEEKEPGTRYASALNVDENMQGLALGEAMMDEALKKEATSSVLKAVCDPTSRSNMRYFEMGFIATGFTDDNPPVFKIEWDNEKNTHYRTKAMPINEILHLSPSEKTIEVHSSASLQELHQGFPENKVLTRCFQDPVGRGDWYAVYEDAVTRSEDS